MTDDNPYMYALTADPDKPLREAKEQIARLTAERDEARRERDEARRKLCYFLAAMTTLSSQKWSFEEMGVIGLDEVPPTNVAAFKGWDCFKEDGK